MYIFDTPKKTPSFIVSIYLSIYIYMYIFDTLKKTPSFIVSIYTCIYVYYRTTAASTSLSASSAAGPPLPAASCFLRVFVVGVVGLWL